MGRKLACNEGPEKAGQTTEMAVAQTEATKLSTDASVLSIEQQISG